MTGNYEDCIECGLCTRSCTFLKKYDINLKDYASREDLAYNCYLCGECRRVCPVKIDGAKISLDLRKKKQESGISLYKEGYGLLLLEKKNYIFKNYNYVSSKRVFFPGCNFPAYYLETTKQLIDILEKEFKIDTAFDCCGKPLYDLSDKNSEAKENQRLNKVFTELGIEELILICPNCYYYFKNKLDIKVSMIYEDKVIMEYLINRNPSSIEGLIFSPCPDKDERLIYESLNKYINFDKLEEIKDIQCCGAGGCASAKEKELTKLMQEKFKEYDKKIYVYCATCAGMITKTNENVEHILVSLIDNKEKVSTGIKTVKNRASFSLKK